MIQLYDISVLFLVQTTYIFESKTSNLSNKFFKKINLISHNAKLYLQNDWVNAFFRTGERLCPQLSLINLRTKK
jgi:hypothetical protein